MANKLTLDKDRSGGTWLLAARQVQLDAGDVDNKITIESFIRQSSSW